MSHADPSGGGYSTDEEVPRDHFTTLARNIQTMLDNRVGSDLSVDQNYTIDLDDGCTYRVTMTTGGGRIITLPDLDASDVSTPPPVEVVWFRFDCDTSTGAIRINNVASTTLAQTGTSATEVEGVVLAWFSDAWFPVAWTSGITV